MSKLTVWSLMLAVASATCYYPNGTADTLQSMYACNNGTEFSACCHTGSECLTNGLCKGVNNAGDNIYMRDSCTDPTWQSSSCPKFCYNSSTSTGAANVYKVVLACTEDTYCCGYQNQSPIAGQNNYACCSDDSRIFTAGAAEHLAGPTIHTNAIVSTSTSTSISSAGTATTTSVTTTSAAPIVVTFTGSSDPNRERDWRGLSLGAQAGIGVGVSVAGLLLVAGVVLFFLRRRKRRRLQAFTPLATEEKHLRQVSSDTAWTKESHQLSELSPQNEIKEADSTPVAKAIAEVDGRGRVHELDAGQAVEWGERGGK